MHSIIMRGRYVVLVFVFHFSFCILGTKTFAQSASIQSYNTKVEEGETTNDLTNVPAGALLVLSTTCQYGSGLNSIVSSTPSLAWTKRVDAESTGGAEIYTAVFTAGGNISVKSNWGPFYQSSVCYVVLNQEDTLGGASGTGATQSQPSVSITTGRDNSLLFCATSDWEAAAGTITYRGAANQTLIDRDSASATFYHYYYSAATTGSYTIGLTSPDMAMGASTAVLEIKSKVQTDITPPSAATLSTSSIESTTIGLTWTTSTDNVGVIGYDVYVNDELKGNTTSTGYLVTGLIPATQYSIYVKSKDAAGNGTNSNIITTFTLSVSDTIASGNGIDTIYRTPGVDSIKYVKNGVTYAIKDSVSGMVIPNLEQVLAAGGNVSTIQVNTTSNSAYTGSLNAISRMHSNIFGRNAGAGATGASYSNFFGDHAGFNATNAWDANFFGSNAGYAATNASQPNFFGSDAGAFAINASNSNFFGEAAGRSATYASGSNFFGKQSGYFATNASNSNFFGFHAGNSATNAKNSIFIGEYSGNEYMLGSDKTNNGQNDYSILIGRYTRTGGKKNSILLGGSTTSAYVTNTMDNQFMLAPNISNLRLNSFDYDLSADTLATRAYARSLSSMNIGNVDSSKWNADSVNVYNSNIGNVGIGTILPTAKFHTFGSVRFESFKNNEQGDSVLTTDSDGNLKLTYLPYGSTGGGSGASYAFANGVTQSNGNVSIGGSLLDSVRLNLNGQPFSFNSASNSIFSFIPNGTFDNGRANYDLIANSSAFNVGANQDSVGYGTRLLFNGYGNTDALWMSRYNSSYGASEIRMNLGQDGGSNDKFHIGYQQSGSIWKSNFVVQANGQVGIGTSQVNGDLSVGMVHGNKLSIGNDSWANKTIIATGTDAENGDFSELRVPGETVNSAYLRLNKDGSIGIGTTQTDAGYRLLVNGRIKAAGLRVKAAANWPDYVFDSVYQLRPLSEVEKFIKVNKHLPEVPTAVDVEKDGHDLSEIQIKLLQKIEELTLYIIDQDKRVKELEDKNKEMGDQEKQIAQLQQQLAELKKLVLAEK